MTTNTQMPRVPVWAPAEKAIPDLLRDIMYMTTITHEGLIIHQYKHIDTRRYINLDGEGQPWQVHVKPGSEEYAVTVTTMEAAREWLRG